MTADDIRKAREIIAAHQRGPHNHDAEVAANEYCRQCVEVRDIGRNALDEVERLRSEQWQWENWTNDANYNLAACRTELQVCSLNYAKLCEEWAIFQKKKHEELKDLCAVAEAAEKMLPNWVNMHDRFQIRDELEAALKVWREK